MIDPIHKLLEELGNARTAGAVIKFTHEFAESYPVVPYGIIRVQLAKSMTIETADRIQAHLYRTYGDIIRVNTKAYSNWIHITYQMNTRI